MESKPNKNEALEALDFIINVLKEHEKDLDRLIGQLGIITESLGETGEITGKIESIEDKISILQEEITNLVPCSDAPQKSTVVAQAKPVNVKCRKWEDFKAMAKCAETVSYLFKTSENTFKADALKNGKLVSYAGDFPSNSNLLKMWLSKELMVNEEDVFEGVLDLD
ncbi:MAG: hypothetical protein IAX21_05705 [Candidatus Bathyarchaeota archaeon]|nr:hypothetical protein [Candidatus Bathyarchaeum tardum]WGM89552.1 MAG: hypothetical protein NUK63_00040 [Candidatus Bathyarchaeum tardum]WNZ30336.1 MAG: hypothetical protein IAX21_05705 [Candidatus Bathyarchaeota archaeon]